MIKPISLIVLVAAFTLGLVPLAPAALISVDFSTSSGVPVNSGIATGEATLYTNTGTNFTGQSGAWNQLNIGVNAAGGTGTSSVYTTGTLVTGDGSATDNNVVFTFNPGGASTHKSFASGTNALRGDVLFLDNRAGLQTSQTVAWTISGLIAGNSYDMIFFGQVGPANPAIFKVFGGAALTLDAEFDGSALGIIANGSGEITGTLERSAAAGALAAWSGFQIQGDFAAVVIPTPAALPAGLALLGLFAIRRRRMK